MIDPEMKQRVWLTLDELFPVCTMQEAKRESGNTWRKGQYNSEAEHDQYLQQLP